MPPRTASHEDLSHRRHSRDGIGTEVISAGVEVLEALATRDGGFAMAFDHFDWGGEYYKTHGRMMPEDGREQIRGHDAILFGSAGHPDIPDHITLWGLRLAICQPFDQYANVRPTRILRASPRRCATSPGRSSTGSSSARIRRANMPASAAASTRACRSRRRRTCRS